MIPLVEIFVCIDDFCKIFEQQKTIIIENKNTSKKRRNKPCRMSLSEIMTIIVMFHLSRYKTFKDFYLNCILGHHKQDFPTAVSYSRFVSLMKYALIPMVVFMQGIYQSNLKMCFSAFAYWSSFFQFSSANIPLVSENKRIVKSFKNF